MKISNSYICEILVSSDVHGHIQPVDYRTGEKEHTGLAKMATLIRQARIRTPELLLLDNGDLLQGTPLSYYAATIGKDDVNPAIRVLNELGYDAAIIGNHEFNYGQELLRKAIGDSQFPWLSAGIISADTEEPAFGKPYIVKCIGNGIRIAVLGVTTHYVPNWENAAHIEGLAFRDALETVKRWVPLIREREHPHLLVVAYHGGFERDLDSGEAADSLSGENQAYAMCMEVPGIDVLITGHQHRRLTGELNGVTVIQPGFGGQALGKITVELEREMEDWRISAKHSELMLVDSSVPAAPEIVQSVEAIEERTQHWLDLPIGKVIGDMRVVSPLRCRSADNAFMEFVNRVQMEAAHVKISNAALLNEASEGFGPQVTMRDIMSNFIYPNTLTVLQISGADIRAALEQTAAYFIVNEQGELGINPAYVEPKPQHYNYDMWEGIEYELHAGKPLGQRVVKLLYEGEPIQDETKFEVVMNNYRAAGGGDYDMFRGKPVVREVQIDMAELVANDLRKRGTIEAGCDHNWRVVGSSDGSIIKMAKSPERI